VVKGQPCRFVAGHKAKSVDATDYRKKQTDRGAIREHILVATHALGHALPPGAEVHHVDGTKRNNRNTNLVICQDHAYHHWLHVRARIVRAGGDPNTCKVCCLCRRALPYDMFGVQANGTMGLSARCKVCARRYTRSRYQLRRATQAVAV